MLKLSSLGVVDQVFDEKLDLLKGGVGHTEGCMVASVDVPTRYWV